MTSRQRSAVSTPCNDRWLTGAYCLQNQYTPLPLTTIADQPKNTTRRLKHPYQRAQSAETHRSLERSSLPVANHLKQSSFLLTSIANEFMVSNFATYCHNNIARICNDTVVQNSTSSDPASLTPITISDCLFVSSASSITACFLDPAWTGPIEHKSFHLASLDT
jgi:hypothetical protein